MACPGSFLLKKCPMAMPAQADIKATISPLKDPTIKTTGRLTAPIHIPNFNPCLIVYRIMGAAVQITELFQLQEHKRPKA